MGWGGHSEESLRTGRRILSSCWLLYSNVFGPMIGQVWFSKNIACSVSYVCWSMIDIMTQNLLFTFALASSEKKGKTWSQKTCINTNSIFHIRHFILRLLVMIGNWWGGKDHSWEKIIWVACLINAIEQLTPVAQCRLQPLSPLDSISTDWLIKSYINWVFFPIWGLCTKAGTQH